MTKEEIIKSALKFLVQKQIEQGSWGFSDADDDEISWDEVIGWLEQQPCEDCISREDALEEVCEFNEIGYNGKGIFRRLKDLPSVQPKHKRGKWIDTGMWLEGRKYGKEHGEMIDAYSCDYCGYSQYHKTNFCPNCGADMREVQNDENNQR